MVERDYVEETLTVSHTGIFDFAGLYSGLKKWFKQYKYDLIELGYKDHKEEGIRKITIRWQGKKKVNDYIKDVIETDIMIDNFEEVIANKKKRTKGELKVEFAAYLEKDYEEAWYRSSFAKFLREVYDKFAIGSQLENAEKDLKKEMRILVNEVKTYLNLSHPRE